MTLEDFEQPLHGSHDAEALAAAAKEYGANPTPEAWDKLNALANPTPNTDPISDSYLALAHALDAADEADANSLIDKAKRAAVDKAREAFRTALAANRPLEVHAPPDYPTPPPRPWLVRGWLPSDRVTLFTGGGGRGKSRLALQLAASLASGKGEWLKGQDKAPRIDDAAAPVVFATYEDEPAEVWRRLESIQAVLGPRPPGGRFTLVDLAGRGPLWAPGVSGGSRHTSTLADLTPLGERLRREAAGWKAKLLILDPLAAVFASNENDRGLVRAFISSWDKWARETECAVLMIAHPPKTAGQHEHDEAAYSGSTDWLGGPRALWQIGVEHEMKGQGRRAKPTGRTARYLSNPKNSYGPDGGRVWLKELKPDGAGEYAAPVFGESSGPVWTGDAAPIEDGGQDGESEATRHMSNAQLGLE